jgi:two-component system cell cycle sensor histidine kinase/response regulator CckA
MAIELLNGEQSRSVRVNSYTAAESAIEQSKPEILTGNEPVVAAALIGEAMPGAAFAKAGRWGDSETILLVEDEAFVRKVTAHVLESAGYRLVIAKSAAEALQVYRKRGPVDLLLTDIVMPGMSGRELAAELERSYPQARILLMSGYVEQLAWCEESAGRRKYLAKPFSVGMLLSRVREVLDTAADSGGPA